MAETLSLGFVLLQSAMQVAVFSLNVRYGLAVMTRGTVKNYAQIGLQTLAG